MWYDSLISTPMRRYAPAPTNISFGPGPITPMVKLLVMANVGIFLAGAVLPSLGRFFIDLFGLRPQAVLTGFRFWQPVTYLFLHGGFGHILFNMLVLWMFGVQLERLWGSAFFLRYYFIAGIGSIVQTQHFNWLRWTCFLYRKASVVCESPYTTPRPTGN